MPDAFLARGNADLNHPDAVDWKAAEDALDGAVDAVVDARLRGGAGGYVLGFRLDPPDELQRVFKEIKTLRKVFASKPIFGIEFTVEDAQTTLDEVRVARKEDELDIIEADGHAGGISLGARRYIKNVEMGEADGEHGVPSIVFNPDLGLAIEELPETLRPQDLWKLYV